ncbi:rubrerythrin family protein [Zavarzinia compransoris]|uniref:Rubrerythrin n=1 Tax=Zavarzinia compransoris TaxID=1264899 RepID=A0A317E1S2_9PROT|nr:rubrerythrin family protein [Zavarzinia compransoris]PWR20909.1 rubrerythrin [Zavarzinia compransoris]TDP44253.1 rubrerythrin [Zavarzinia compransoris]
MSLAGTRTLAHLLEAFAREAAANRRYLYFAQKADVEGYNDVASVFRSTAEGESGHAFGLLDFLDADPTTGEAIGDTRANLLAAIAGEIQEFTEIYPRMAAVAREEGLEEVAAWFDLLAKAEKSHAARFRKALDTLD